MGKLNSEVHRSDAMAAIIKSKKAKLTVTGQRHRKLVEPEANIIGNVYQIAYENPSHS